MAHLPPYPDSDDADGVGMDKRSTAGSRRRGYLLWIIGAGLLLLVVVLHLSGVRPGGH